MSFPWTSTLRQPLASCLERGLWDRVEDARDGGWWLLAHEGHGDGTCWYHLDRSGDALTPVSLLDDTRLDQLPSLVAGWLRLGYAVQLLGHKMGRRAILLLESPQELRVAKVYRKDRNVRERWSLFANRAGANWSVPRIIDWDPRARVLLAEHCSGTSLNRTWLGHAGAASHGDRVADLLRWIADTPLPATFPAHGHRDEARILQERLPVFESTLENPPARASELTERVVQALAEDPAAPAVACHRDFHDKQILLDGERGALIDLDVAAAGPPALDAGNILAHLRLRHLKGARIPWQEIAGRIAAGVLPRVGNDTLHRWTAATLLRLALIYSRRHRGPSLIEDLLDTTEQALERRGEWHEIIS